MAESIFDTEEISSLFEEVTPTEKSKPKTTSLFDIDEDAEEENVTTDATDPGVSLFDEGNADDTDEDTEEVKPVKKTPGRKPKEEVTPFGEAINTLVAEVEDFLIYEEEDGAVRTNYTKEEFVDLFNQNIDVKVEQYVEGTLKNIIESFSPSIQKIIQAELKGVKVKDLIEDIREYEDIESIPAKPSEGEKESIVKRFYKDLAKERGRDDEWVTKTVEKIIDRDDLDTEFEDAVKHFEKKIDERIKAKEDAKEKEILAKHQFKQHHAYVVNEVLKDNELFGIPLDKKDKQVIGDVLAGYVTRKTDNKEKLRLTAIIDQLIHDTKNQKESYQKLALMSLAVVNPQGMIKALKGAAETTVTQEAVKKLKVADKKQVVVPAKKPVTKSESFF